MPSYGGGFAAGLNAGVNAGRAGLEAYDWGRKRQAEEEAGAAYTAQPEETTDFDYNAGAQKKYKLGNQYQDTPYSPEQLSDYRTNAAADAYAKHGQIDKSLGIRKDATQQKLAQTQLAGAQRNERYGHLAETSMALIRRVHGGEDPIKVYQEAAQHFNQVNDGKTAGLSDDGMHLVINDAATGQAKVVPATPENAIKAITALHSLSSPQAFEKEQDQQLKSRQVGAAERQAATQEQYRKDQQPVLAAQAGMYNAHGKYYSSGAAGRAGIHPQWTPMGQDADGQVVSFNRTTNAFARPDGKPIKDPNFWQKTTGARGPQQRGPMQPVQGNPGMFTDGEGMFQYDDRTRQMVPIESPQQKAARIAAAFGDQGGGNGSGLRMPQPSGEMTSGQALRNAIGNSYNPNPALGGLMGANRNVPPEEPEYYPR